VITPAVARGRRRDHPGRPRGSRRPRLRSVTPSARRRLLLVHAHPDDETLTTGGTVARYAAEPDTSVTLVTCTLGEQGEVIPPELGQLAADAADQLGGYRIGELAAACAALGVTDHRFLGGAGRWRDSGMVLAGHGVRAATPAQLHPRALAARDALADQVDALTALLEQVAPQVVVTYAADGGYGHPDHVRAHDVTVAAVRRVPEVARLFATVQSRTTLDAGLATLRDVAGLPFRMPAPDELPTVPEADVALDVAAHREARLAALAAHATQVALWPGPPVSYAMSNGVAQPLLDVEEFVLLAGEPVAPGTDDLFAGVA
jgi:N-acetyl-1-D-myo-inositol-2-amino-2-deoxy-alpha-D-glucopyranoside deacetylase